MSQWRSRNRTPEVKALPAGRTAFFRVLGNVGVGRHGGIDSHLTHIPARNVATGGRVGLPAGLGDSGNQAVEGMLAEGHTGHLEAPDIGTTTSGDTAAVDEASRARVSREEGKAKIVVLRLELLAEFSVFCDSFRFAFVSFEPAGLCHKGAGIVLTDERDARENFLLAACRFLSYTESL